MHPIASVVVNGTPVAGEFWSRLISLRVTDRVGVESDAIEVSVADGDPFLEIPQRGDRIQVSLGYRESGLVYMGEYVADTVEVGCLPYSLRIDGKAADVRKDMKSRKERHWDDKTLKEILEEIAAENGLQPKVSVRLGKFRYDWLGQQDESDLHFIQRLAKRHGAIASVKDGKLVFAKRGEGESASGDELPPIVLTRPVILANSCRVRFSDRGRHKRVITYYEDKGKQKRKEVEVESDPDADGDYRIPDPFGSEDEARSAAESKSKDLKSAADTVSVSVEGAPDIFAGAPLVFQGIRPGIDGLEWVVETVTHSYSKSGYTTTIDAKRKPEAAEGDGAA